MEATLRAQRAALGLGAGILGGRGVIPPSDLIALNWSIVAGARGFSITYPPRILFSLSRLVHFSNEHPLYRGRVASQTVDRVGGTAYAAGMAFYQVLLKRTEFVGRNIFGT